MSYTAACNMGEPIIAALVEYNGYTTETKAGQ
jgi:hypothetical protein